MGVFRWGRIGLLAALVGAGGVSGAQAQDFGTQSFVDIHGYADLTYFDFGKEGDPVLPYSDGGGIPTFDNNHLTLFFGAALSQNLKFSSEFHYEHSMREPELPQANIQWRIAKPLTITMGRFWLPFGTLGRDKIYNPTSKLVSYSYIPSQFLPFHNADNGVKFSGTFGMVGFEAAVTNGFAGLDEDAGKVIYGLAQDNNQNKRMTGRVALMPVKGVEIGGSYTTGAWDDASDADITFWGLDGEMQMGPLSLEAEYASGKIENPAGAVSTVDGTPRVNLPTCNTALDLLN
ncbi:MAG TPA: porin, partial [Nitrospiria bacterium]